MRKISLMLLALAAIAAIGCDGGGVAAEKVDTGKSSMSQTKAGGAVQNGGVADLDATPAPAGVQTGVPAGGKK